MAKISEYLKDKDGKPSATRLFSLRTLNFFFVWTTFSAVLLLGFAKVMKGDPNATSVLLVLAGYFAVISVLSLIGAFAPKQLSKIQEVKELIGAIRGKSDIADSE